MCTIWIVLSFLSEPCFDKIPKIQSVWFLASHTLKPFKQFAHSHFSYSAGKLDQSQVQQRDVLPGHIIGEELPADGVRASSLIHGYSRRTPAVAGVITTNYLLGGHSVRKSIDFSHSEAESRKVRT